MLQDTHLPLWKWFLAIYTIIESKKGVSANQLKRELDMSYKTAWYLCHRIRAAISQDTDWEERVLLSGIIEMDETFVGGKTEGKGRGYKGNKALVVGVVQRDGEIVLQIATDRTRKTLHEIALKHIAPEAVAIFTNQWPAYTGMGDHDTRHETVNHSQDEFVRGDVHTNTVEGVWTHKGLVHFDDAGHQHSFFSITKLAHSSPNSVAQVPSSFVGNVKSALKLVGRNALLGLAHHVDRYKPLVERQMGIV
jgi:hypothetical protein